MRDRLRYQTDEDKLAPLRRILRKHGRITADLVRKTRGAPSAASYERWFGGLIPAYELIGYTKYRRRRPRQHPFRSSHAVTARLSNLELLETAARAVTQAWLCLHQNYQRNRGHSIR